MTVRGRYVLALALASPVSLACAQQKAAPLNTSRPRSTYDPAAKAGAPADSTSAVEKTLHAVNPQDKDYGALFQSVRLAAIEETFHNVLWWADVVLLAGFFTSLAGNYWQSLRSEHRLRISSAIVAQLYNSHVASRSKAMEAIEKHNLLADRYNAKCDEEAREKEGSAAAEQRRAAKGESRKAAEVAEQQIADGIAESPTGPAQASKAESAGSEPAFENQPALSDADDRKRHNAQLTARDQKITNLRAQLHSAHQRLEEERKRKPVVANG